MLEFLIPIPNILAQFACMVDQAYYANILYSVGYLLFIYHNIKIGDTTQFYYFSILEVMALGGVVLYLWKHRKHAKKQVYYPPANGGYSAVGEIDLTNPPQGGSGFPSKPPTPQPVKIEREESDRIECTWN